MILRLLDFLFPRRSLTGGEGELMTADELRSLRSVPVILETAALRAQGLEYIDRIVAAADYDSVPLLHRAVHLLKYKKVRGMGSMLGKILLDVSVFSLPSPRTRPHFVRSMRGKPDTQITGEGPVLCPVPLHWIRKFSRGFNQSEILAHAVGQRGWEVRNLLRRVRWTGSQVGRHRRERLIGVKDAFAIRSEKEIPSHVILVDDLSTTGATLNECAKVLKNAGVKNVEGLVLALG